MLPRPAPHRALMSPFRFLPALCVPPQLCPGTLVTTPSSPTSAAPLCAHWRPPLCSRCPVKRTETLFSSPGSSVFPGAESGDGRPFLSEQAPLGPGSPSDKIPERRRLRVRVAFCRQSPVQLTLQTVPQREDAGRSADARQGCGRRSQGSRWLHRQRSGHSVCFQARTPAPPHPTPRHSRT